MREETGVSSATLLTASGALVAQATESVIAMPPVIPSAMELRQVRAMQTITAVEPAGAVSYTHLDVSKRQGR